MQTPIFIGTLHALLTPHEELRDVLENCKPEQLLVEIDQSDIENHLFTHYPDEMQFAYAWAVDKGIPVFGFDASIDTRAGGKTERDNQIVIREQEKILKNYNWKEANTLTVIELLDTLSSKDLTDPIKERQREQMMLQNIEKLLSSNKKIVILTGVGHLPFFKKHFTDALFPFSDI